MFQLNKNTGLKKYDNDIIYINGRGIKMENNR